MDQSANSKELFIIPCCKSKQPGGKSIDDFTDDLQNSVSPQVYEDLLSTRSNVLSSIRADPKYLTGPYFINSSIQGGSEFGASATNGQYLPAIERYVGALYSRQSKFVEIVRKHLADPNKPKLLILSALYGPLLPLNLIQDYNLKISDRPAYKAWKEYFPTFLENYVQVFGIRKIRLYLGGSTAYFKVAKAAVAFLKNNQLIEYAVQYDVKEGGSYLTPYTHGQLVLSHLQGMKDHDLENKVVAREL